MTQHHRHRIDRNAQRCSSNNGARRIYPVTSFKMFRDKMCEQMRFQNRGIFTMRIYEPRRRRKWPTDGCGDERCTVTELSSLAHSVAVSRYYNSSPSVCVITTYQLNTGLKLQTAMYTPSSAVTWDFCSVYKSLIAYNQSEMSDDPSLR